MSENENMDISIDEQESEIDEQLNESYENDEVEGKEEQEKKINDTKNSNGDLDALNVADEEYLKSISQVTDDEIRKGKNMNHQKNIFDFFIGLRISLQKIVSKINLLPQQINSFENVSHHLGISQKDQ
jgi:hypothetical protein